MAKSIPDYLVRYCVEAGNPFVSLNELPPDRANQTKDAHCEKYGIGGFYAEADYLVHRREIERWMFARLVEKGGRPKCAAPVYMFLGEGPVGEYHIRSDIQKGAPGYKILLSQLDMAAVSFCYPDSMIEMEYDERGIPRDGRRTNTPEVLLYSELEEYARRHNVHKNPKFFFEAHVWDKERLNALWERKEYTLIV